ncbi:DUF924 family protein [Octadecabacter sp. 1_MG-2023]|uniref:DUF924 family protein n=1 Tax=unclassified Octadecabacter TaxID=196158 RepID=UPI001C085A8B|nr:MULTISPECIES: DUF924 family protein [unclassified Octadecabacter]MBU2993490.1 DUF924 domain-containing protein [Octadecabacter sp. B2R22]MDO6733054.1 DUF924 family protein [Octadecabacter sp. 1_MG-2023]
MVTPEQVLSYWLDEVGPRGWYKGGSELDGQVREKFESTWAEAQDGACGLWLTSPIGALGYIILMDQFPRNMFRDQAAAFASDQSARAATKVAIEKDWDMKLPVPARQFFYLPLMHSENLIDQDRAVRLIATRMTDTDGHLRHARAHRTVIRQFGRFPYRNAALGRKTTKAEGDWLSDGGYMLALREVDDIAAGN